jgi:hypothetical protein
LRIEPLGPRRKHSKKKDIILQIVTMTDNNPPQPQHQPQILLLPFPNGGTTQKYLNGTLVTRSFYLGKDGGYGYSEYTKYDEDNAKKYGKIIGYGCFNSNNNYKNDDDCGYREHEI